MKKFFLCLLVFCFTGCGIIPTRIFQKKVPPPITKAPAQIENERQAADLIAQSITAPPSLKPVAQELSSSLGKPEKPLPSATPAQVDDSASKSIASLSAGMVKLQEQVEAQNRFIAKYAGKTLDDTGFSLLGPGMGAVVIGLIALAVLCPPALTLMIFAFRRLKAAAGIVVNQVEAAAKEPATQAAVNSIKAKIESAMQSHPAQTTLLKDTITNLKT